MSVTHGPPVASLSSINARAHGLSPDSVLGVFWFRDWPRLRLQRSEGSRKCVLLTKSFSSRNLSFSSLSHLFRFSYRRRMVVGRPILLPESSSTMPASQFA